MSICCHIYQIGFYFIYVFIHEFPVSVQRKLSFPVFFFLRFNTNRDRDREIKRLLRNVCLYSSQIFQNQFEIFFHPIYKNCFDSNIQIFVDSGFKVIVSDLEIVMASPNFAIFFLSLYFPNRGGKFFLPNSSLEEQKKDF